MESHHSGADENLELSPEELRLSNEIHEYLANVIEQDPYVLIALARGEGGNGRIFNQLSSSKKEVDLMPLDEPIKEAFAQAHGPQNTFLQLTKPLLASVEFPPDTEELLNKAIRHFFDRLITSNPKWEQFKNSQMQIIRAALEEESKDIKEEDIKIKVAEIWHDLENTLATGLTFQLQSTVVEHAKELGEDQEHIYSAYNKYTKLIGGGLDTKKAMAGIVTSTRVRIIEPALDVKLLDAIKNGKKKSLVREKCDILCKIIKPGSSLNTNSQVASLGEIATIEILKILKETLKTIEDTSLKKKKLKKFTLETAATKLLSTLQDVYGNDNLRNNSPEIIHQLNELNILLMHQLSEKNKLKYTDYFNSVMALQIENTNQREQHAAKESMPTVEKEKEIDSTAKSSKEKRLSRRLSVSIRNLSPRKKLSSTSSERNISALNTENGKEKTKHTFYSSDSRRKKPLIRAFSDENEGLRLGKEKKPETEKKSMARSSLLQRARSGNDLKKQMVTKTDKDAEIPHAGKFSLFKHSSQSKSTAVTGSNEAEVKQEISPTPTQKGSKGGSG